MSKVLTEPDTKMHEMIMKKMEGLGLLNAEGSYTSLSWEGRSIEGTNCRLLVNLQCFPDDNAERKDKPAWYCSIAAVPENITEAQQKTIRSCMCIDEDEKITPHDLFTYGSCVTLARTKQQYPDFTEWLSNELPQIEILFGFFMDKPVNAIGTTGWERLGMK